MKNRQFIVLCILVIAGFCVLYFQNKEIIQNQWFYYDLIIRNSNLTLDKVNDMDDKIDYLQWHIEAVREKVYKLE